MRGYLQKCFSITVDRSYVFFVRVSKLHRPNLHDKQPLKQNVKNQGAVALYSNELKIALLDASCKSEQKYMKRKENLYGELVLPSKVVCGGDIHGRDNHNFVPCHAAPRVARLALAEVGCWLRPSW